MIRGPTSLRLEMCLETPEGRSLQCRSGEDGLVLGDVLLRPGDLILDITGERSLDEGYTLRIQETSALIQQALKTLVQREAARRLARLGGSAPKLQAAPRRQGEVADDPR